MVELPHKIAVQLIHKRKTNSYFEDVFQTICEQYIAVRCCNVSRIVLHIWSFGLEKKVYYTLPTRVQLPKLIGSFSEDRFSQKFRSHTLGVGSFLFFLLSNKVHMEKGKMEKILHKKNVTYMQVGFLKEKSRICLCVCVCVCVR